MNWLRTLLRLAPWLETPLNKFITNRFANATVPRPHRFSLWDRKSEEKVFPVSANGIKWADCLRECFGLIFADQE